jgi:hypothetical protein
MIKNTFVFVGILAILLLGIGMVSAVSENGFSLTVIGAGSSTSNRISGEAGDVVSFTVQFNNTNATQDINLTLSGVDITSMTRSISGNDTFEVSFTIPDTQATKSRTLNGEVNDSTTTTIESISDAVYYTVNPAPTTAITFCENEGYADQGDLEISDFDINNNGEGKDDEWQKLDEIEIRVDVENTNKDDNIDDVEVRIAIYDDKIEDGGNDVTNDFDFEDDVLTDIGRLKDDDEESVTFVIPEVPADLEDGTYYMYIMAYSDGDEDSQCISESSKIDDNQYFKFSVESVDDDEAVVARGTGLETFINTYCGQENVEVTVPVYNLGSDDQDNVLVNLYNAALGVNENYVINNLDEGDDDVATFLIDIPEDLSENKYDLKITVYFDWDDDEDEKDILAYDEQTSDRSIRLDIISCAVPTPTISATLESEAMVGEEMTIKALITNNGKDNDFVFSISDFEAWADMVSVSPQISSIDEGEFVELTIKLIPTKAGTQSFNINTIVDGQSFSKPVSVNVTEEKGLFGELDQTLIYIIIGIIVVLILIFIVLIVKIAARRPVKPQF